ncbi:quinolinate synthase NadA [bacterium]|nr:quinolinate synthase NadA [candidate division CSSED10-310 bacterium]
MIRSVLVEQIRKLKQERRAVLLVHNYQHSEVQDLADYLGDSLDLAIRATTLAEPVIVFCGVHFMAESAKLLCPSKTVLLPEHTAGCPLADCATGTQVREYREKYPDAVFVAYINTSAEVKAECDICVTSANALTILAKFPDKRIVYLPDKNLAAYAALKLKREIIVWPGQCYVHDSLITLKKIQSLRSQHPNAKLLAHPEAPLSVLSMADVVTGTSGMIKWVSESDDMEFIIATEVGLVSRMRKELPDRLFYEVPGAICSSMKLTTLHSIRDALQNMKNVITIPPAIAERAQKPLRRMLEMTK